MTIQIANNNPRISYTATGGQTAFPTSFAFFVDGDINVYINDVLKTLTTDYAVTGGSGLAGTVTLVTGATAGDIVVLTRDVELERTTDFPTSGPFQVASLNVELDKLVAMIADMEDFAGRGLRLSDSDTSAALVLANKDARKGTVLAFNTVTGAVEVGPTIADTQSIADIKADIALLADIEDGTVATDAITDLAAVASDVTTAASNIAAIQGASTQAANAATSATASATSASAAAASATAAATSATAAETAETNAETAETNAETAETNAATSATASASSATASAGSATAAAASATAAAASETAAQTAETNAETAETNAETAETNASTSATAAAGSATAAAGSATAAASSATAAAASETAAATSETNAATSETNAATSATAAASSATSASTSASTATTQASNASTSATAAAASQVAAANSAAAAANTFDNFDDTYLGTKASDPTVDNDGDALVAGALYFNSTDNEMRVYDGGSWIAASSAGGASLLEYNYTATAGQTTFSGSDDNSATLAYVASNLIVTLNGIVLENGTDYTATNGTSIVLTVAAAVDDELNVVAFKSFTTADMVPASTGGTFTGNVSVTGNLGVGTGSPEHALSVFKDSNGNRTEIGIDNIDQRLVLGAYFESGVGQYSTIQSTNNAETTATSLVLQPDGGNIGVGTSSSPNATLQVEGTDDANNLIVGHNNTDFAVYTDSTVGEIRLKAEDGSGSNFSKYMTFYTHPSGSAATERLRIESNGNLQHLSKPAYFARAWVNFNGTGTVAIRSSRNVSSVTDNGTGNYTVNLTTAVASNAASITDGGNGGINRAATSRMISTTECDVRSMNIGTNQPTDVTYIDVVIFD
jgi:hypothetical protein